jgi:hypothetical protein
MKKMKVGEQRAEAEVERVKNLGKYASTESLLRAADKTRKEAYKVIKENENFLKKVEGEIGREKES